MPKGKGKRDYDKEIEETAKRIKKYPESLKSARNSKTWHDFLINIADVNPDIVNSDKGNNFWDSVRDKVNERKVDIVQKRNLRYTPIYYLSSNKTREVYRDSKGRFASIK